ncbi:polysulfide reductase NrfD [Halodesulfurarchaeum formicicum]|uniref:Polysulfide reductase NrfD n=1 Tax=Halodesulfurarchaeum formicicum TaxID=1873524 RepID=A0A1D8S5Q6_9EURY|nr:NrfD/PsrC family molybdoenzyme membrane anchor subunit [Halodesulfurarchaeum formicicum]AOW80697.1 polysulfide reductase NrfD [Halodesulfurarchaeum formicicum]APE96035.1 polysulfide reductase NrfD [Halodesulfurarchaeum formicicum]
MATASSLPNFNPGFEDNRIRIAWYGLLVLTLLVGAYATYQRIVGGMATTNLTSITPWGAWVAFYIYFIGLSAGAFLVSTLANVFEMEGMEKIDRDALFAAIIAMVVAMLFVWIDLGRMERMYFPFIWRQLTSALSWEVHAYVAYIGVLTAELYFSMRADLVRVSNHASGLRARIAGLLTLGRTSLSESAIQTDRSWLKRIGILGIPLAIFFVHGGTGILFAGVKARAYWNSGLFPVIFVVSALLSGTALVMAVYVLRRKLFEGKPVDLDLLDRLGQLLLGFVLIDAAFTAIEALIGVMSLEGAHLSAWLTIALGKMAWSFWIVMVGLGWVVPLILTSRRSWRRRPMLMVIAGLSVVIGIVGVRFNIVVPPLVNPVMEGLPAGDYLPSLTEWATSFGIVAVGLLIYTLGAEVLPLTPLTEEDNS